MNSALPGSTLPTGWRWHTANSAGIEVFDCPHSTPKLTEEGPFVVRTQDIDSGTFRFEKAAHVSLETYRERVSRAEPRYGDILYSREGAYYGVAAEVPANMLVCLGQRMVLIRPPLDVVDHRFLKYWMNSPAGRAFAESHREGSAAPRINLPTIRSFPIPLPSIGEQRGIAVTLGALDDKIESNRLAGALLQQLCRSIFSAWRGSCDDSSAAESTFGDFAEVFGGATPKTAEADYWNGGIAWATPTDMTALSAPYLFATSRTITDTGLESTSATLHPPGTIFMTSRATIGVFAVNQMPAATNQGFIAVRPKEEVHRWFLLEEMRSRVPEYLDNANGSTFLELSRGRFKELPLIVPDQSKLIELDDKLRPLHAKAAQLDRESTALMQLRDTLLPELLSGRVRVPEAKDAAA